jgi:N-acetylglutamate synthase-like GNAT family acetyltransferase
VRETHRVPFSVRRLHAGDENVLRLLAEEAPDFDLPGREPQRPLEPAAAADYLASAWVLHWVAEEDGRVLGDLVCHVLPLPYRGTEMLLYSIGVREAHRRRGVGRALVDEMFRRARADQIDEIWVLADNPDAEAFYAACGFRRGEADEQGLLMLASCKI